MDNEKITRETPILDSGLSVKTAVFCKLVDIQTVGELLDIPREELCRYKYFSHESIGEIDEFRELHRNLSVESISTDEGHGTYRFDRVVKIGDRIFIPGTGIRKGIGSVFSLVDQYSIETIDCENDKTVWLTVKGRNYAVRCNLCLEELLRQINELGGLV